MIKVEDHLKLVSFVAKRFTQMEFDDAFQIGCEGLIVAAKRYDKSMGTEFSTYAYDYIFGYISQRAYEGIGAIKIPRRLGILNRQVLVLKDRGYTLEEIAKKLDETIEQVKRAEDLKIPSSLSFPIYGKGEVKELQEVIADESERFEDKIIQEIYIDELLKDLSKKERELVELRISGKTQIEIGEMLGKTRQAVSAAEKRIMIKLRKSLAY